MKQEMRCLCSVTVCCLCVGGAHGQGTIPTTGGNSTGTGVSVTYTVGQIGDSVMTGINSFIIQGVQQPYEISTVTAIEDTEDITLNYSVYPNPTEGTIRPVIKSFNDGDFSSTDQAQNNHPRKGVFGLPEPVKSLLLKG